jgi:hypothetical protein
MALGLLEAAAVVPLGVAQQLVGVVGLALRVQAADSVQQQVAVAFAR